MLIKPQPQIRRQRASIIFRQYQTKKATVLGKVAPNSENTVLEHSCLQLKNVFKGQYFSMNEYIFHNKLSMPKNQVFSRGKKMLAINEVSAKEMAFSLNINSFKKRSWESYMKLSYALILLKIPKTYPQYLGQGTVEHLKQHTQPKPKETVWKPAMKFT